MATSEIFFVRVKGIVHLKIEILSFAHPHVMQWMVISGTFALYFKSSEAISICINFQISFVYVYLNFGIVTDYKTWNPHEMSSLMSNLLLTASYCIYVNEIWKSTCVFHKESYQMTSEDLVYSAQVIWNTNFWSFTALFTFIVWKRAARTFW